MPDERVPPSASTQGMRIGLQVAVMVFGVFSAECGVKVLCASCHLSAPSPTFSDLSPGDSVHPPPPAVFPQVKYIVQAINSTNPSPSPLLLARELLGLLWRFHRDAATAIARHVERVNVTVPYIAVHIRRGDKNRARKPLPLKKIVQRVKKHIHTHNVTFNHVFVMTDDHRVVHELQVSKGAVCVELPGNMGAPRAPFNNSAPLGVKGPRPPTHPPMDPPLANQKGTSCSPVAILPMASWKGCWGAAFCPCSFALENALERTIFKESRPPSPSKRTMRGAKSNFQKKKCLHIFSPLYACHHRYGLEDGVQQLMLLKIEPHGPVFFFQP